MNRSNWMKLMVVVMIACATTAFAAETTNTSVRGNPDSKVYHKPTCRYYNAKSSSKEFKSEAEAKKAGYKPCKQCAATKKEKKAEASGNSQ